MSEQPSLSWHQPLWQQLQRTQKQGRMPHAILLSGSQGLGKRILAEKLVSSLLCTQADESFEACGHCHSCQLMAAGSHPDHTVVSPEDKGKAIKVDQIRALKQSQTLMPKVAAGKTVLITHADKMNINAFNSLLKLLEEPQPDSTLILLSENAQQLPVTIKSRCQMLVMPLPTIDTAISWLQQADSSLDEAQWRQLLKVCHGAPLAALELGETGLAQCRQVTEDMGLLMQCRANPVQLAASWQQLDLTQALQQIQGMMQTKLGSLLTGDNSVSKGLIRQYWAIADCITETLKLISSQNNLNKTLLIEDFMVTVMQHADKIHKLRENNR